MKELIYHRLLLPAIEQHADKVAFHDGEYHGTYADHGDRVFRLCRALRDELGVEPGDRFAVMGTNNHQFLELYHAAFLGAGIINPLNLRLAGPELEHIVRDSGTEVVFVDALFAQHFVNAMASSGAPSPIRHIVLIGEGDVPHDIGYEDLIATAEPVVPEEPDESDVAVLMYTGGTTGRPKGVVLDHRAEMLNLYHILMVLPLDDENEVFLHQTPMFHAASMGGILGIPYTGAESVFIPLFDPPAVIDLIDRYKVTQTVMVPTMIAMLLDHPEYSPERLGSLKTLNYGASPMPAGLLDQVLSSYPDLSINQGYGMTESSALLTMLRAADHRAGGPRLRSAGTALPGVALSIRDEEGNELPGGETGEVCARAGNLMNQYWGQPEATAAAFRDGWYHTGDAGYIDDDGYLFLVDRVKDMIVSGGENIYSAEIESVLSTHPAVAQVAVIGVPHATWGEQVHAVVVVHADATTSEDGLEDELVELLRNAVAGYKVPKSFDFRTEPLPLSGAMKVMKRELREQYRATNDPGTG